MTRPHLLRHVLALVATVLVSACATRPVAPASGAPTAAADATPSTDRWPTKRRPVPACGVDERPFDCDRRAILAMVGEFEVSFRFDETAVLAPGYERREPHRSRGFEFVELVEDTGNRIRLQHVLVSPGGRVTKHWRQDWIHEAASHWRFVGDQRFEAHARDAEAAAGTWTQLVYEVSDAPRYAGSGRWNHRYGVSTWTSERTWRPLPRREYTTRDDYDLLNVENRHTITPDGWTHEQDNTKVARRHGAGDRTLVREFGFNEYRRITGFDFGPGRAYWQRTAPFWATVRARWDEKLAAPEGLTLAYPVDDEDFIGALFTLAAEVPAGPPSAEIVARIDAAFVEHVHGRAASIAATPDAMTTPTAAP